MAQVVELAIGPARVRFVSTELVLDAVRARFSAFAPTDGSRSALPIELEIRPAAEFAPAFERPGEAQLTVEGDQLRLTGGARGAFDLAARRGFVEEVTGLGPVDALMRAALAATLPLDGALLVHGALAGDRLFVGASGAGKSTIAAALLAACDELAILTPGMGGVRFSSTPYWQGRPHAVAGRAIVVLRRAPDAPGLRALRGAQAVRALLPHVVRYLSLPEVDRAVLALAGRAVAGLAVLDAACPVGAGFVPFLTGALAERSAA